MDIQTMLNNFVDTTRDEPLDLRYPFEQGGKIMATNGHVAIVLDKVLCGTYTPPVQNDPAKLPDIIGTSIPDYESYKISGPINQVFIDGLKLEYNYPYRLLKDLTYCYENEEDCDIYPPENIHLKDGIFVDFRYIMLLEMLMLRFGGDWTMYLPDNHIGPMVFTNGPALYVVMPMKRNIPDK